ncbi:MAG: hypothetical protein RLZZ519_2397 [Bacteroidota bacterium]|jgi:hypothetical protein
MKLRRLSNWVTLCLLLLAPCMAAAQATGFMGLRNAFGYECTFAPILYNELSGRKYPANPNSSFTVLNAHSVTYERCVKRKSTIMLEAQYRKFGTVSELFEFNDNTFIRSYYSMRSTAFRFRYKFFPLNYRGLLAPLGPYLELITGYSRYGSTLVAIDPLYDGRKGSFNALDFGFGFGQHWVAADRLLIDFGFKFVFPGTLSAKGFPTRKQDYRPRLAHFSCEGANFKLGIAYMVRDPKKKQ